jgi:hypothetical protein
VHPNAAAAAAACCICQWLIARQSGKLHACKNACCHSCSACCCFCCFCTLLLLLFTCGSWPVEAAAARLQECMLPQLERMHAAAAAVHLWLMASIDSLKDSTKG